MKTDCLTSSDGELMIMAAHRGTMHQSPEDIDAFTEWYINYCSPVVTGKDKLLLTRDTITDGFSTLWSKEEAALWVPFFMFMWESLEDTERELVDRMVAYTRRENGSQLYEKYYESDGHGMDDDDEGCPESLPTDHPLESKIGQRMIINMHRYCLGRMTYMPEVCRSWLKAWWHYVELDTRFKMLATTGQALLSGGCGADCDAHDWLQFFLKGMNELDTKDQEAIKAAILKEGFTKENLDKVMNGDASMGVFKWTRSS